MGGNANTQLSFEQAIENVACTQLESTNKKARDADTHSRTAARTAAQPQRNEFNKILQSSKATRSYKYGSSQHMLAQFM